MARILLVRHGQSEANAGGIVQGRLDYGLTELGLEQARLTAERLLVEPVLKVVTSPLKRAHDTALAISRATGAPLEVDPAIQEYDIGEASGLTIAELRERFPAAMNAYAYGRRAEYPGEEGRTAFRQRLESALERLHVMEGTVVAVAHGGVVSALCQIAFGLGLDRPGMFNVANCSVTELERLATGRTVVRRHNDTCHLAGQVTVVDRG